MRLRATKTLHELLCNINMRTDVKNKVYNYRNLGHKCDLKHNELGIRSEP